MNVPTKENAKAANVNVIVVGLQRTVLSVLAKMPVQVMGFVTLIHTLANARLIT